MTGFRTLDRVDVKGKRILLRVDLNVPVENGVVADATRIERAGPAITELADKGGKVILLSHFGRPKGRDPKHSLKPVAAEVARIIKRPVKFADDCIGEPAARVVAAMTSVFETGKLRLHRAGTVSEEQAGGSAEATETGTAAGA